MATIKADQIAKKAVSPRHLRSLEKPSLDAHAMRVLEAESFDELKLPNMKMFCESWPSLVAANSITGITGTIFAQGVWQFLRPGSHVAYTLAHDALGMNFARTGYAAASEYGAVTLSTAMECLKPNTPNSGFVFGLKYDPTATTGKNGWANKHTSGATIGAGETAFFDVGFVNSRKSKASVEFDGIIFYANDYGSDMNGYSITIEYVPGSGKSLEITDEDEEGVVIQLATNGGGTITTIPTDLNALTFEYVTAACTGTDAFTETVELTLGEGVKLTGGVDAVASAKTIGGVAYAGVVTYEAQTAGVGGNAITVQHIIGAAESVAVDGMAITVTLDYGISTAASVAILVNNDASASALVSATEETAGLMGADPAAISLTGGGEGSAASSKLIGGVAYPGQIMYIADAAGAAGNSITIQHIVGEAEACVVDGTTITITLAYGVSTADSIKTLVDNTVAAAALVAATVSAPGLMGVDLAPINLENGADAIAATITLGDAGKLTYTAVTAGAAGNSIAIWHKEGGEEAISVDGNNIDVTLNSGTSTAASIESLVDGTPAAAALVNTTVHTAGVLPNMDLPANLEGGVDGLEASILIGGDSYPGQLTYTAVVDGEAGDDITIQHVYGAGLSVAVVDDAITITLAYGTSTAANVAQLINEDEDASALVSAVATTSGLVGLDPSPINLENGDDGAAAAGDIGGELYPGKVTYTAATEGADGDLINVIHLSAAEESVSVAVNDVVVYIVYGTSTAASIAQLINEDETASALVSATAHTAGLMATDPSAIFLTGGVDNVYATGTFGGDVNPGVLGFTSKVAGTDGDDIVINITHGIAESCTVDDDTITVVLNSGASTAATIAALIAATTAANALITAVASVAGILDDGGNALNDNLLVLRATPGTGAKWKFVSIKNGVTEFEEDTGITIVQSAAVSMRVSYEAGTTTGTLTIEWYVGTTVQTTKTITVALADITGLMSSIQFCGFYEDTAVTAHNDVAFSVYNDFFRYYVAVPVIS